MTSAQNPCILRNEYFDIQSTFCLREWFELQSIFEGSGELDTARSTINTILVTLFQQIMGIEERRLKSFGSDLTVKEAHVIEAVVRQGKDNTMKKVAARLNVTIGSLTVAVSTLEKKGYLKREKGTEDRRKTYIVPTEKALKVDRLHEAFHSEMTQAAMAHLDDGQLAILVKALENIHAYFSEEEGKE